MKAFFDYLGNALDNLPAYVSLDFFGLTLDSAKTGYDLGIGQRLLDGQFAADYLYPMAYPSHYADGYLGFGNPADHPYEVIRYGLKSARPLMEDGRARLRIWIQAFNLGAVYDGAKIRAQIRAVEEDQTVFGWLLWNARNVYGKEGLR